MLKGHVFKKQVFGHQIFAVFINTFLGGQNGISNNYKNEMEITYSGSILTVQSGVICIQGRFLEEDTSTDIVAGTDTSYCKLVIEIDLDKQNTETEFVQGTYKIIKSTNNYPELTQTNIVKQNSGTYQYELARFKTSSVGITDFQDMRTFLDFNSIYIELKKQFDELEERINLEYKQLLTELETLLQEVENESTYVLNNIQQKTIDLVGNTASGGTATGKIVFQKQGRVVTAFLEVITDSSGAATLTTEDNINGFQPSIAKTFEESFFSICEGQRGINTTELSGVGKISITDLGDIDISVYSPQSSIFKKSFSYMS